MTRPTHNFQLKTLIICFIIMAFCEAFFIVDVIADLFRLDLDTVWFNHDHLEVVTTLALALSLVILGLQIRHLLRERSRHSDSLKVASGQFVDVIDAHFRNWNLSKSESDVALMLMKGFSTQEIADLRTTKPGTVKSQTSAIYQKAGLRGRNELVAFFVEDLLSTSPLKDQEHPDVKTHSD